MDSQGDGRVGGRAGEERRGRAGPDQNVGVSWRVPMEDQGQLSETFLGRSSLPVIAFVESNAEKLRAAES